MRTNEELAAFDAVSVERRAPRWVGALLDFALVASLLPACVGVVMLFGRNPRGSVWLAFVPLVVVSVVRALARREVRALVARVSLDRTRIVVQAGRRRFSVFRRALAAASVDHERHCVILDLARGGQVVLAPRTIDELRRLERWAGARPADRALRLALEPPVGPFGVFCLGAFGAFVAFAAARGPLDQGNVLPWVYLALGTTVAAACAARVVRSHVEVGLDGIAVQSGLFARFVPATSVTEVRRLDPDDVTAARVLLVLSDGDGVELSLAGGPDHARRLITRVGEIVSLIDDGADGRGRFRRQGRDLAAWKRHLSTVIHPEGRFRDDPVTLEAASRVLGNASASPEARVGASLALRAAGVRIAVGNASPADAHGEAAAVVADPEMRRLFALAAEDEVDEKELFRRIAAVERRRR